MSKQEFIANDHFVHGGLGNVRRDQTILLTPALGADLGRRGLVRPKHAAGVTSEKLPAAGGDPASSASQAAQVSPQTIAKPSDSGAKVPRKGRRLASSS